MLKSFILFIRRMLSKWVSWCYINILRRGFAQGKQPTIDDIAVLYKSKDFIAVNKHQDVRVNSDDPRDAVTVETQLVKLYPEAVDETAGNSFRFLQRLDYATSGALCVATSKASARWGHKAFEKRYVTKHYLALVRGELPIEAVNGITVTKGIGRDSSEKDVNKMCVEDNPNCIHPRNATSTIYLLEHGTYKNKPVSKVLLVPQTGRTHQLRVHCLDYGYRIVGDYCYSNRQDVTPRRMMLHAYRLVIPMKRELIDVTAPDPFLPELDPLWVPTKVMSTYEKFVLKNPIHYGKDEQSKKSGRSLDKYGKKYRHKEESNNISYSQNKLDMSS